MHKWDMIEMHCVKEVDGTLHVMESGQQVPFEIKRIFIVSDVAEGKSRGNHATKKTRLILFAVSGSCKVVVDDGVRKDEFLLNDPKIGLLIEPMVWRSMSDFTKDCVVLAVCDRPFSPGDETFLRALSKV